MKCSKFVAHSAFTIFTFCAVLRDEQINNLRTIQPNFYFPPNRHTSHHKSSIYIIISSHLDEVNLVEKYIVTIIYHTWPGLNNLSIQ